MIQKKLFSLILTSMILCLLCFSSTSFAQTLRKYKNYSGTFNSIPSTATLEERKDYLIGLMNGNINSKLSAITDSKLEFKTHYFGLDDNDVLTINFSFVISAPNIPDDDGFLPVGPSALHTEFLLVQPDVFTLKTFKAEGVYDGDHALRHPALLTEAEKVAEMQFVIDYAKKEFALLEHGFEAYLRSLDKDETGQTIRVVEINKSRGSDSVEVTSTYDEVYFSYGDVKFEFKSSKSTFFQQLGGNGGQGQGGPGG